MIGRRALLSAMAATLATGSVRAQPQPVRQKRVGFIGMDPQATAPMVNGFLAQLAELGWRDGETMTVLMHWVHSDQARATSAAATLVAERVDVIFATNAFGVDAVRSVSSGIPVVFAVHGDPIGSGHVASLARPGGNVTGVAQMQPEVTSKSLQLLQEAVPMARRVAVFFSPRFAPHRSAWPVVEATARQLGIEPFPVAVDSRDEIEPAFERIREQGVEAMLVISSPVFTPVQGRLAAFAISARLPSVFGQRSYAEAGGMLSFGPDVVEMHRRAAFHVDKILRGASPSELPVEQPNRFELIVNLRTARTLGQTIPSLLLARADEVIE